MADTESTYRQRVTTAVTAVVLGLSTLVYGLRLLARSLSKAQLQVDDYLMGVGVFLSWGIAICNFVAVANGLGRHEQTLSHAQLKNVLIATFVLEKIWSIAMCFVKCSIISLYMRVFRTQNFRIIGFCLIAFSICWALSGFIGNTLQCIPPAFFYDKSISGSCMDPRPFFIAIGSISFVEDVVILSTPMPWIWRLSINARKKIALTGIFLLGAFVCVTSVLRLTTFQQFSPKDVTYTNTWPGLWTYIELGVGSICGSLPLLRPIFGRILGLAGSSSRTYQEYPHSSSRPWPSSSRDAYSRHYEPKFLGRIDPKSSHSSHPSHGGSGQRSHTGPNSRSSLHDSDEIELMRSAHITVHTEIRQEIDDMQHGSSQVVE